MHTEFDYERITLEEYEMLPLFDQLQFWIKMPIKYVKKFFDAKDLTD